MDYVNGGVWSEKAAKEAGKWARVHQPAASMDTEAGLSYPPAEQWWVSLVACSVSRKQPAPLLLGWQLMLLWSGLVDSSESLCLAPQAVSGSPCECRPHEDEAMASQPCQRVLRAWYLCAGLQPCDHGRGS